MNRFGLLPIYYVGQSQNVHRRKIQHLSDLKNKRHGCLHMQNAYNKYGVESFVFCLLEECAVSNLHGFEQWWLDMMVGDDRVMNVLSKAMRTCRGTVSSEATRAIQSQKAKQNWASDTYKERQLAILAASRATPETRRILSEAAKKRMTPERREASRQRLLGVKQSRELIQKRSAPLECAVIGTSVSDGTTIKYKSMVAARIDGFQSNRISEACSGIRGSHKGYRWQKA